MIGELGEKYYCAHLSAKNERQIHVSPIEHEDIEKNEDNLKHNMLLSIV